MRRQTYIAHPLGAGPDREKNRQRAALWVAWAAFEHANPVATWITLSGLWEETPDLRAKGLALDCALVECCTEDWLVGGRVSPGMEIEAAHARKHNIKVVDLTHLGEWPPGYEPEERATRETDPAPAVVE
jgi:hypothetical protein